MTSVNYLDDFSETGSVSAQAESIQVHDEADLTVSSTTEKMINEFWWLEKANCSKRKRFIARDGVGSVTHCAIVSLHVYFKSME